MYQGKGKDNGRIDHGKRFARKTPKNPCKPSLPIVSRGFAGFAHRKRKCTEPWLLIYEQFGDVYDRLDAGIAPPYIAAPFRAGRGNRHVRVPLNRSVVGELDHFAGIVVFEPYEMIAITVPQRLDLRLCLGKVNRLVPYAYVSVLLEVRDGMFRYSLFLSLGARLLGRFKPAIPGGGLALEFLQDMFHTTRRDAPAISFLSCKICNGSGQVQVKLFQVSSIASKPSCCQIQRSRYCETNRPR